MEATPEPTNQPSPTGNSQDDNWFSKDLVRFFEKVQGDWESGCWNWTASQNHGNYARFWDGEKPVRGHRWIYETFISAIPSELELDHLCVNASCVAPYHLEPVTRAENQKRKAFHRAEAAAGRPIRIKTGATTSREITFAFALGLPIGGVIVLPGRPGSGAVRSTTPPPYGTLPMPARPIPLDG